MVLGGRQFINTRLDDFTGLRKLYLLCTPQPKLVKIVWYWELGRQFINTRLDHFIRYVIYKKLGFRKLHYFNISFM